MEYKPFMVSLEEFFTLDEETRDKLTIEYYSANRRWFHTKLRELNAEYLVIGGTSGNVYRYGSLQNFPEEEELEAKIRTFLTNLDDMKKKLNTLNLSNGADDIARFIFKKAKSSPYKVP